TWDFNPSSVVGGITIDSGVSTQVCHRPDQCGTCTQTSNNWFAGVNNLLGNITAIAPDMAGSHVYVLIGKHDSMGTYRIYFADYDILMSIGATVYRTLAALGDLNARAIDTPGLIDPFFSSATDIPEPNSWSLVLTGLTGAMLLRRRKNKR